MGAKVELGVAFAVGAVVALAFLSAAPPAALHSAVAAHGAPAVAALARPIPLAAAVVPQLLPRATAGTLADDIAVARPADPSASLWAMGSLAATFGTMIGYLVRCATQASGMDGVGAVDTVSGVAMAAIMGKNHRLSRDRQDMLIAPWTERRKFMSSPLSKELRAEHGVRTMVVRKGDTVRVRAGDFKNTLGKVTESDIKALRVYVEGIDRRKNNGKMVPVALHPSQLEITTIVLDDPLRKEILDRRAKGRKELAERRAQAQAGQLAPVA